MTKTLKFLIPSLLVAGLVVLPTEAQAVRDTQASKENKFHGFKENKFQAFKENKIKETEKPRSFEGIAPSADFGDDAGFWTGQSKQVPELSSSAAGASLALLAGGLLAISGRRRRRVDPK
jgi:hypothetical protein